jgi:cystathionine beta-lyase
MDYAVAPAILEALGERVRASDFGYIDAPGPLAGVFADFAARRWDWAVDPSRLRVTTDVSTAIVETLRYGIPVGGTVVINPPVYTAFYELISEARATRVEVPLLAGPQRWSLDLDGLEQSFAAGADAYLLCNPQNPTGTVFDEATLREVARLAARYDVLVISDEVHAPLGFPGVAFAPFLRVAEILRAAEGVDVRCVCVTSASKGWNLAGTKCAILVPGDRGALDILDRFPEEVTCRTSILGLHANVAAFSEWAWLEKTVGRIVGNAELLDRLVRERLPAAVLSPPDAGYLAWIDLRAYRLGPDPAAILLDRARVALNSGHTYGSEYDGFVRINFACEPEVLVEAIERIGNVLTVRLPSTITWTS